MAESSREVIGNQLEALAHANSLENLGKKKEIPGWAKWVDKHQNAAIVGFWIIGGGIVYGALKIYSVYAQSNNLHY